MPKIKRSPQSFRLPPADIKLLNRLSRKLVQSKTSVVREALKVLAEKVDEAKPNQA